MLDKPDARCLRKEEEFLRFFAEDESEFRESSKKALDNMKRHSGRLKKENERKSG